MHNQYKDKGFIALSVNLDDPHEEGVEDAVKKFLTAKKAPFNSFILDEKPEFWEERLKIDGVPFAFVFDREGKVAKKFEGFFEYVEVEKTVKSLLDKMD